MSFDADSDPLVFKCVSHLQEEYAALLALNSTLEEIGEALRRHETTRLPPLLDEKQSQMRHVSQIRQQRQSLMEEISLAVPTENEVSIANWAARLDVGPRKQILELRSRLLAVANRAARLAQTNMVVVSRGLQVLEQVMDCLTDQGGRSERYSAEGHMVDDPVAARSPRKINHAFVQRPMTS